MKRLEGKVAVVTGAGNGIGRAEALALAAEGAMIVINDLGVNRDGIGSSTAPADVVVQEIKKLGGKAVANYDTIATHEGAENIIKTAIDSFGRIDILVNNAGVIRDHMIYNMTDTEWDTVMKVHLYGYFYCTRAACVHFRQQRGGRIVNTSSISGLGSVGQANYSAAKEGVLGLTKTVALEMGKYGVTCNAICPVAATRLNFTPEIWQQWEMVMKQGLSLPTGTEIASPEDLKKRTPEMLAPMVVYLSTDEAANVNGCTFSVSGGEIGIFRERYVHSRIYKDGVWTQDQLSDIMPKSITRGLVNPAPAQPPKS